MQVQCVLCDTIEDIDDQSLRAKRLRNRRLNICLCQTCYNRIGAKTKQRHATGNFQLYKKKRKQDEYI